MKYMQIHFTKKHVITAIAVLFFSLTAYAVITDTSIQAWDGGGGGSGGCCGGGDDGGGGNGGGNGDGGNGDPTPTTPTCNISINKGTVSYIGESYRVTWSGTPSSASFFINGSSVSNSGQADFEFTGPNYDRFRMVGNNGGVECEANVRINFEDKEEDKPAPKPTCDISAYPSTITKGDSSTLSWTTNNAESASINQSIGSVSTGSGERSVSPNSSRTYTMTVLNEDGKDATCSTTVTVEDTPDPEPKPVCKDFSAYPHTITKGDSSTLNWDVKHAHTITINQGVGEVTNKSEQVVSPAQNTTYTLTAYGADDHKVQCNTTVKVEKPTPDPDPITCEENVNFSASPSRIDRGNTSTLTWSTSGGITDVSINRGIGDVGTSGSEDVSPNTNTTYTLTASDGTDSIDCNTTLRVDAPTTSGGGGGGGAPAPRCELNISDRNIEAGDDVTLTWNGRNVSDVEITNDEGDVIVSTFDRLFGAKRELFSGSRTITPAQSTTYTMVAESGRRTEECTVAVNVEEEDEVTVEEEREQDPLVAGIAVSDTPYTGFDASTMLATTFYGLLTIWGLFVGYVILRRRQGEAVPAFAARAVGGAAEEQRSVNPDLFPQQYTPATSGYTASATAATPVAAAWQAAEATAATPAADAGVAVDAAMQTRMDALEQHAHTKRVLVSRDALALFVSRVEEATEQDAFDTVIDFAAAAYPAEDGWVVVNVPRMEYILG